MAADSLASEDASAASANSSGMIVAGWLLANPELVDAHGELDPGGPALKRGHAVQLRRGHPEIASAIDPHRVDPQQARILDDRRHGPFRCDFDYPRPIGVAGVDIPGGVDRGAARRWRVGEALDMLAELYCFAVDGDAFGPCFIGVLAVWISDGSHCGSNSQHLLRQAATRHSRWRREHDEPHLAFIAADLEPEPRHVGSCNWTL